MKTEAPKSPAKPVPDVTILQLRKAVSEGHVPVLFAYVPGDGLWAAMAGVWSKSPASNPAWDALRRSPTLAKWITEHPLSVVYGELNKDGVLGLSGISSGGTWLPQDEAQNALLTLLWVKPPATVEKK